MSWVDGITDSMDMSLSKLRETVEDRPDVLQSMGSQRVRNNRATEQRSPLWTIESSFSEEPWWTSPPGEPAAFLRAPHSPPSLLSSGKSHQVGQFPQLDPNSQLSQPIRAAASTTVRHLPTVRETRVQSPGWEPLLEKETATHSSILAWRIPWTEESGGLQSMGSQRVGHD